MFEGEVEEEIFSDKIIFEMIFIFIFFKSKIFSKLNRKKYVNIWATISITHTTTTTAKRVK